MIRKVIHAALIPTTLLFVLACGAEWEDDAEHLGQKVQPVTKSATYQALTASITAPATALPGKAFAVTAAGTNTSTTGAEVFSYALYENAKWSYSSGHKVVVASGKLIKASGFNWGKTYKNTFNLTRTKGTYKYTFVFGFRGGAHNWYDLAVETTVTVKEAASAYTYHVFGKDSARTSRLNRLGYTYVNLAPLVKGHFHGNIKVTYDKANLVECFSIEETPDGPGMWNWWTTATADPSKGSTGKLYQYKNGGGLWAKKWVAQGKGYGKPGSIDTGAGGKLGHLYMYTSGSSTSAGFKPLRLGFRLKTRRHRGPIKVRFQVYSNALYTYDWHASKLGAPVAGEVTLVPAPTLAWIDVDPNVLSAKSKTKWITAYIELIDPRHKVGNIKVSTVALNNKVFAEAKPVSVGDYDKDGRKDLMVKFDRAKVIAALNKGLAMVTISGMVKGTPFVGRTLVVVIK